VNRGGLRARISTVWGEASLSKLPRIDSRLRLWGRTAASFGVLLRRDTGKLLSCVQRFTYRQFSPNQLIFMAHAVGLAAAMTQAAGWRCGVIYWALASGERNETGHRFNLSGVVVCGDCAG
jgi:hypothetical protein